jgi:hypothetical protein
LKQSRFAAAVRAADKDNRLILADAQIHIERVIRLEKFSFYAGYEHRNSEESAVSAA